MHCEATKGMQRTNNLPSPQLPLHLTHLHFHSFHHHQRSRPRSEFAISHRRVSYLGSLLMEWSRSPSPSPPSPRPGQSGPTQWLLNINLTFRNSGHKVHKTHSALYPSAREQSTGVLLILPRVSEGFSWVHHVPEELWRPVFQYRHSLSTQTHHPRELRAWPFSPF